MVNSPVSGAESDIYRERRGTSVRDRTIGRMARMSLDGAVRDSGVDRQPGTTRGAGGTSTTRTKKSERRKTLTELFSGH